MKIKIDKKKKDRWVYYNKGILENSEERKTLFYGVCVF